MLRRFLAVALTIVAILAAGWLSLRRGDISYDTLETSYSVKHTKFLTLSTGAKIHYTDTGPRDRSAIVLVHGFSSSLHTWQGWADDLDDDFRVITLDLPGHGLSRVDDPTAVNIEHFVDLIHTITDALGVETFTLAGNSMGGNTAWAYALKYPENIEGLVLVDASGWPKSAEERENAPFAIRLMSNGWIRALAKDLDTTFLMRSGLRDSYTDQAFVTDELVDRYVSLSRAPGHRDVLIQLLSDSEERVEASAAVLADIQVPTLIMWGEDDKLVPVSDAQKFHDSIAGSDLVIYPGIGHLPQEEAAAQSLADMRAFMMKVEFNALEDEVIIPAGDPRLVRDRADVGYGR